METFKMELRERVTAWLNMLLGIGYLCLICYGIKYTVDTMEKVMSYSKHAPFTNKEYLLLVFHYTAVFHCEILTALLSIVSGIIMLLHMRWGWQVMLIAALVNLGTYTCILWMWMTSGQRHAVTNEELLWQVACVLLGVLLLLIAATLLSPGVLQKYKPTRKQVLISVLVTVLILGERLVNYYLVITAGLNH